MLPVRLSRPIECLSKGFIRPLKRPFLSEKLLRSFSSTSVEPLRDTSKEEEHKDLKSFETLKNITKKTRVKKPQRPPFVKNLLLGEFDTEILTYPQLEKEDVENLEKETLQIQKLLKQKHMVNVDSFANKNFRQNLSDYRAIGLQASQFLDGKELEQIESTRFIEALSEHNLRESIIHNEQLSVQALVKFGSDQLKKKYLHPMIHGEKLAAFCLSEENMGDIKSINTRAKLSDDEKHWILNGSKTWVVNGASADSYIVLAVTEVTERDVQVEVRLSVLLVDKDCPGVSCQKIDNCSTEMANVKFQDVPVPVDNMLGALNNGEDVMRTILSDFRLKAGASCIALSRKLLNNLHDSIIQQVTDQDKLHETDAVKSRVGEMMVNLYAMESVTYLTAGLGDWYEKQDTLVESSIVKAFCSQTAYDISSTCLDMIGIPAVMDTHWCRKLHNDCINYLTLHETNESQKLIIALMCLQHAGQHLGEQVKTMRNPLYFGTYHLKRMFADIKNTNDNPKLDLRLGDYLHPSLDQSSLELEYCVKRLEWITKGLFAKHGLDIVNKHLLLRRLAEAIIHTYAATACLGRSSRAYCIGLPNAESEILMTHAFCENAQQLVRHLMNEIITSPHQNSDDHYDFVAKRFFTYKGYYLTHPTARNI